MTTVADGGYRERILGLLGDRNPLEALEANSKRVETVARRLGDAGLSRSYGPGKWTGKQILAHLADAEVVGAWRIRSVLAGNGTALQPYDQDRWAATFRYAASEPSVSLDLFQAARASTLSLLGRVDPALHDNFGMHGERGKETVTEIARLYAGHDRNHLAQVERLLAAQG